MTLDDYLADQASRFATVAMTDTNGLLRGQMVSANSLKGIAKNGMGMAPAQLALDPTDAMLIIPGVNDDKGDFHDDPLQLDPGSARRLPWSKAGHDLLVLSNYTGASAQICPRAILKSVLARAGEAGLVPKYGMELEYTLFDETPESAKAKGYRNLKTATAHASHDLILYQVVQTEWYEAVAAMCEPLRIDLAKMHEEIGAGFMEACIGAGEGLEPADQLVLLKNFIRALALRQGRSVTFMPRWNEKADSQSIHLHISLKDKTGRSLFWDAKEKNGVSRTFRHFLGGLQAYVGDTTLVFQPTVNSYRRFAPGTFAPPGLTWGFENRTTCFRLVGHDAGSLRVENRLPGADSNPYLSAAATIAAGVAGVIGEIEPNPETIGSGYAQQPARDFARSMPEAIDRLRGSAFAKDWLGARFVEAFTATRESQHNEFRRKVPDVELERFFDLG
ncbi:MAG: glutamine synthetase [Mesorhizobium sp.]|uniref:glutamine synthetase family protein n=2 Tax=Mesorhizobium TaxID=68287 RepID=UPI000F7550A2|nr:MULTISPECIES: glutamine synthetase family protein [unclassified Mesorhizobium]RVD72780.1 glutamine synthetase [Mesorhizobium sp. M4A.F.Ca.ET.029.04.2.1]AZO48723.1 glutamine synthetase [Mesorhizobium sp. M4B.F.Ca.ET.058.02.1.1]RUX52869.1 glutamine synthetase [Mesorhizobium sp. M4A.F.Ca.ET.050.02.1.1]RVC83079.1 glutamine synthetase [Mesorhizobium sp. M4A.F.Ca.ET.022.05.2.1]RVD39613.1 glutamine synthetase [Mesorhizobium sp. M4A.F.Ca.ET.020.02.1.1]